MGNAIIKCRAVIDGSLLASTVKKISTLKKSVLLLSLYPPYPQNDPTTYGE